MVCPHCGQAQRESSLVISTICKSCGAYLKIEKGKVTNHQPPREGPKIATREEKTAGSTETSLPPSPPAPPSAPAGKTSSTPETSPPPSEEKKDQPSSSKVQPSPPSLKPTPGPSSPDPPAKEATPAESTAPTPQQSPGSTTTHQEPANTPSPSPPSEEPSPAAAPVSRFRPSPDATPKPAPSPPVAKAFDSLLNRKEKKRSVRCFECAHEHQILADSTSALCPRCGAYIGLKDYDIRDRYNSRIQTRGSVFVHKKGSVTGITIQCHNLTIEGEIKGGAECSGDFIIRKTGKISGRVSADRLFVQHKAKVEFLETVEAREVIIDGNVSGSVSCKKLTLKKHATLDGDLTVSSLAIEEGARHSGRISMVT
ncbi:MAG: polymer-forming cytoskeletal protein [Verrucomicrobiota bacterium JB023]|nr:polymer-forming cytoskeletal protein [Verrucomicrobiota bacterium JB023]